jgi:hypothetical protein
MPVDLKETIRRLRVDLELIETAIASLEAAQAAHSGPAQTKRISTRGRKSMGATEREDVSARMKKYWASRRAAATDRTEPA